MKIVKAGYEIMPNFENPLKKIELVARTCYKSEDLITEDSYKGMINNLIQRQHYAMLEHASLVYIVDYNTFDLMYNFTKNMEVNIYEGEEKYLKKSFIRFSVHNIQKDENIVADRFVISGNLRAFIETFQQMLEIMSFVPPSLVHAVAEDSYGAVDFRASLLDEDAKTSRDNIALVTDFSVLTIYERFIHETFSVKFTVDRGVTHELARHRDCSFAQESTRFCNYSKGKFGNEITVVEPCFFDPDAKNSVTKYSMWQVGCEDAEEAYFDLLNVGATPQQARDVLPTSIKAEIIMTTNICEWIHILELRALGTTGRPHPQMEEVMIPLAKELVSNNGLLSDFTDIDSVNRMIGL